MKKNKLFVLLFLVVIGIVFLGPFQYLTLENLKLNRDLLEDFYTANPLTVIGGYLAAYSMVGLLLLPGATFLSFAAGFIFGTSLGSLVVIVGSALGGALAFLVSRYLLRDWVEERFSKNIKGVNENLCEKPLNSVLFFRLVPLFPFFAVNIGMALSQMPLKYFILGTMLGKLPATFVYTNAGNNLAVIHSFSEIMSMKVLVSLSLLGFLALVPVIYKKMKVRPEN